MTKVINIKNAPQNWKDNLNYQYIGREGFGLDGYFGNPYILRKEKDREKILEKYTLYFESRLRTDEEFTDRVKKLKGKILVCFCEPKKCHGDIIVKWINSMEEKLNKEETNI